MSHSNTSISLLLWKLKERFLKGMQSLVLKLNYKTVFLLLSNVEELLSYFQFSKLSNCWIFAEFLDCVSNSENKNIT